MPRDFTPEAYKAALDGPGNRTAKGGWKYHLARVVSESEIFEAAKIAVSRELENWRRAWQRTRIRPAQVRALGRQLQKHPGSLERVIVQYTDLLPFWADGLFPQDLELVRRIRLETRHIPSVLKAVAARLVDCRGKASDAGEATVRRGRVAQGPSIPAGMNLLNLFWKAKSGFFQPGFNLSASRRRAMAAALPAALMEPPADAPYAWAAELLNLACRLTKCREVFSADNLRKMQEERSL